MDASNVRLISIGPLSIDDRIGNYSAGKCDAVSEIPTISSERKGDLALASGAFWPAPIAVWEQVSGTKQALSILARIPSCKGRSLKRVSACRAGDIDHSTCAGDDRQ